MASRDHDGERVRNRDVDSRTIVVFGVALACLWAARFAQDLVPGGWTRLAELNWWASSQILFYGVVPVVVLAFFGVRARDVGWRVAGTLHHGSTYIVLFAISLPFVITVSGTADFQDHYPILEVVPGQADAWRDLAIWWPFYVVQFAAIEAFFRGVLVLGLAPRLGSASVFVATVPYMMIHFVKPPAEAAAAIIGGVVLGMLALRTRSIVWGIALHVAVAASMDLSSLAHKGFLW